MRGANGVCLVAILSGLAILAGGCSCSFPGTAGGERITLLSYNVQNLFDDVDNGTEYHEYDPGGGEWGTRLFHRRLLSLARTLRSVPDGGADIILLQEIENRNVLEQLKEHYLSGGGYHYTGVTDVPDSAINLGCLSRLPIEQVLVHGVNVDGQPAGRPLMELVFTYGGKTLRVLHCHWKSKVGGAEETEVLRRAAAAVAAARMEELSTMPGQDEVLIVGDLNENIDEWERIGGAYPIALMPAAEVAAAAGGVDDAGNGSVGGVLAVTGDETFPEGGAAAEGIPVLYSPWIDEASGGKGSYYYDGSWETVDHVLLPETFWNESDFEFEAFKVVREPWLLRENGRPLRWISRMEEGHSDHLPLLLRLRLVGKGGK